jgi:hypothetical protein
MKLDMAELLNDFAHMTSIGWQSAAVLPSRGHFVRNVAKHMEIPTINFDGVLEVGLQLVNANLGDVGPNAQYVREVADLDWVHLQLSSYRHLDR